MKPIEVGQIVEVTSGYKGLEVSRIDSKTYDLRFISSKKMLLVDCPVTELVRVGDRVIRNHE